VQSIHRNSKSPSPHPSPRVLGEGVGGTAAQAKSHLQTLASATLAEGSLSFFKTGPDQYGEGDQFIGISAPALRAAAAKFADFPLAEIDELLQSPIHEHRTLALIILGEQYQSGDKKNRQTIYRYFLKSTGRINNWDLVDGSAPFIVGPYLLEDAKCAVLYRLAKSKSIWDRRIAVVSTAHFIKNGRFDITLDLAEKLMGDTHDLMHKAIGWMLREVGKKDEAVLRKFLAVHAHHMPRTMLRYSIERFSVADRKKYLAAKTTKAGRKVRPAFG
jgi:3-methyladenine DNA glycosylase AlkD